MPKKVSLRLEHMTRQKRFIQVNVALIAALGGDGNAAIVLTAIEFWTELEGEARQDGHTWWKANRDKLAEKTGFSPDKIRRLVEKLVQAGALESVQLDAWDRTYSYRIVLTDGEVSAPTSATRLSGSVHLADSPDASGESASSTSGESARWQVANPPDEPLYRGEDGGEGADAPARPPHARPFPHQCRVHQDEENDHPCGACGRTRKRYESWMAEQAEAAARARGQVAAQRCQVDGHEHYPAVNCPGCRADSLAAS